MTREELRIQLRAVVSCWKATLCFLERETPGEYIHIELQSRPYLPGSALKTLAHLLLFLELHYVK